MAGEKICWLLLLLLLLVNMANLNCDDDAIRRPLKFEMIGFLLFSPHFDSDAQ